jgi:hypothetical protein
MRRMILASLVLVPVVGYAQTSTSINPQPSSSVLVAELLPPVVPAMHEVVVPAASASLVSVDSAATHAVIREVVKTQMNDSFTDAALRQAGTLQYDLLGAMPSAGTAPRVLKAVEMDLSDKDLATQPAVTNVSIHATVDAYGFPRNLTVAHSAGAEIDKKAMAAVSQYRFEPAMRGNRAVEAPVTISIKIEKP